MKIDKRTIFLLLLLAIVTAVGYPIISGNNESEELDATVEQILSPEVVAAIAILERANVDASVLSDPEFSILEDFSLPLINLPVGRLNPFSAIR